MPDEVVVTPVLTTEETEVLTPEGRYAAARTLYGKDRVSAYRMTFPETKLTGKSLYNAAALFDKRDGVKEVAAQMREFSGARLSQITTEFIDHVQRDYIHPAIRRREDAEAKIAEFTEDELRAVLLESLRREEILEDELKAADKRSPFSAKLGDAKRMAEILKNIGEVVISRAPNVVVNMAVIQKNPNPDGRFKPHKKIPLPLGSDEWRFHEKHDTPIHNQSYLLGKKDALEKSEFAVRCPAAAAYGENVNLCYQDIAAGGDGNGGKVNE